MNSFQNVTHLSGLQITGQSWGTAWGDANQDGLADVYVTRHFDSGQLWINLGDGTFLDQTARYIGQMPAGDSHGAAWADVNNDGAQDLIQLRGSDDPNLFYLNTGQGQFNEVTEAWNLTYPGSGRNPQWFDSNQDGKLDLALNVRDRDGFPSTIFEQGNRRFNDVGQERGYISERRDNRLFSLFSDINNDGRLDLLTQGRVGPNPLKAYDVSGSVYEEITLPNQVVRTSAVDDIVLADFDGDLQNDIFLARSTTSSDVFQPTSNRLNLFLKAAQDDKTVRFKAEGEVTFQFPTRPLNNVFIGANSINPDSRRFTLSPNQAINQGEANYDSGTDQGIYIHFDPQTSEWVISWSNPNASLGAYGFVWADRPISDIQTIGFRNGQQFNSDKLFLNRNGTFQDVSAEAGFRSGVTAAVNAVSGDFDNDMDLDLYVVSTGPAGNRNNVMYENQGDGTFVAQDLTAANGTRLGLGDAVTTVDYDQDGALDLFISNGNFFDGFGGVSRAFFNDAPYQLLKNEGNDNHWLQIDLVGTTSNRDAIGSRVIVTAGQKKQLREQSGGMHSHAQNHQRLHFGLGQNFRVPEVDVQWVSGIRQFVKGVNGDQILEVVEGRGSELRDVIIGTAERNVFRGLDGRDRLVGRGGDDLLNGGAGNDSLEGNVGNDLLQGGLGHDLLKGGSGNDRLVGDLGEDTLVGGTGQDQFVLQKPQGVDIIQDFNVRDDVLEIKKSGFGVDLEEGTLQSENFVIGSRAQAQDDFFIFNRQTQTLLFDADGSGQGKSVAIASFSNQVDLRATSLNII